MRDISPAFGLVLGDDFKALQISPINGTLARYCVVVREELEATNQNALHRKACVVAVVVVQKRELERRWQLV